VKITTEAVVAASRLIKILEDLGHYKRLYSTEPTMGSDCLHRAVSMLNKFESLELVDWLEKQIKIKLKQGGIDIA